jgi:hypothetical protein
LQTPQNDNKKDAVPAVVARPKNTPPRTYTRQNGAKNYEKNIIIIEHYTAHSLPARALRVQ